MNDERPIEKLLRRYAKKRRDDAGAPELHPATRRLLQSEVARQYPKKTDGGEAVSFAQILKSWLPWLGWATAMVVIVGIAALMNFGGRRTEMQLASAPTTSQPASAKLALNDEVVSPKPDSVDLRKESTAFNQPAAPPPVESPRGALAPVPVMTENKRARADDLGAFQKNSLTVAEADREKLPPNNLETARADASRDKTLVAPAVIPAEEKAKTESYALEAKGKDGFAGGPTTSGSVGGAAPLASRAMAPNRASATGDSSYTKAAPSSRGGGFEGQKSYSASQSFAETETAYRYVNTAKSSLVLTNFQIKQEGNQVRVIDSDGSTYSGELLAGKLVEAAADSAKAQTAKKTVARAPAVSPAPADAKQVARQQAETNFYRVSGTNRTLKQQVVFTWNFEQPTNSQIMLRSRLNSTEEAQLQRARINGRVQVGAGKEMELNATPYDSTLKGQVTPAAPAKAQK